MNDERSTDGSDERVGSAGDPGSDPAVRSLGDLLEDGADARPDGGPNDSSQARRLRFTANGWEYFRIWIVNVALTLLTLGIYSAWAKVRARRYLYGHVWLDDAAFDYTAKPIAILKGRILLTVVLVLLWFAQIFAIWYYYAALLALMPLVPWVVVRARSFQMRNSRHRGIAFDFQGKFWDAAVWYPLSWAASIVTLGLARPFTVFGRDRFLVTESRFGNKPFSFVGKAGPYYRMYIVTVAVVSFLYLGGYYTVITVANAISRAATSEPGGRDDPYLVVVLVGFLTILAAVTFFILAYLRTRLLSYRWSCSQLGESDFILRLSFGTMFWLYASNAALIITTFGLFAPFARIRVLRYVVDQFLIMQPVGEVTVEAGAAQRVGATGAEAAGEFGLEIGI